MSQIEERLASGDYAGATRLAAREQVAAAQHEVSKAQLEALSALVSKYPEADTEFTGSLLASTLREFGLNGTSFAEMEYAYKIVLHRHSRLAETPKVQTVQPAPARVVRPEPEDALTTEARKLIASGRVSKDSIAAMTPSELERAATSSVFAKCLELLEPKRPVETSLSLGDFRRAEALSRATRRPLVHVVRELEAEVEQARAASASQPARPAYQPGEPTTISDARLLAQARKTEREDRVFIEDSSDKSRRRARVIAHRRARG